MNHILEISYPEELPDVSSMSRDDCEKEARLSLAVKLFETGRISSGKAVGFSGMGRVMFLMSLQRFYVSLFNYDIQSLEQEIINA